MNRDAKKVLQEAERQGFTPRPVKKGVMYLAPDGRGMVTVHKTPSDHRDLDNMIAQFRRAGLIWPPPGA